jgi:Tol biopolymer transport system component
VALAGLAGVFGVMSRSRPLQEATRTPEIVPFTTLPGQETAPTFSPDGSQIAFAWRPEGQGAGYDLYVKVLGSEKLLRLTHNPSSWIAPSWSPDGRRIAFARRPQEASSAVVGGVFLIPALGGAERRLFEMQWTDPRRFLSWAPDGTRLSVPSGTQVFLLDVATLEARPLPFPVAECERMMTAAFSPDGESLASVCAMNTGSFSIFAGPATGSDARLLVGGLASVDGLAYAADARSLVYASRGDLWRVPGAGGPPARMLSGVDAAFPALSRGGQRLAYARRVENTSICRIRLAGRLRAEGPSEPFLTSSRLQAAPAISPDGRRVAFVSNRSGPGEIWISSADGSDPVALTSFGGPATGSPAWSPSGEEIVFDSRPAGDGEVFVVRADGGVPRRVETGIRNSFAPSFSRDGKWLYFCGGSEVRPQVYRMPYPRGPAVALTKDHGYWPRESADGARVHFVRGFGANRDNELWSVSVKGGDEAPVPGFPRMAWGVVTDWTPVHGGIYFVDGDRRQPGLAYFDLTTREARRVADIEPTAPFVGGLAVAPDGTWALFSRQEAETADIMLVEGFK